MDTLTFRSNLLPFFAEKMAALAKVSAKLQLAPMTWQEIGRETQEETYELASGEKVAVPVEYVSVSVDGTSPQLPGGWQFVGAIEHLEAGNLLHGDDIALAARRYAEPNCEHCGYTRNRKSTVLLRNEAGDVKQVGSTCLKDFLGYHSDPLRIVSLLETFEAIASDLSEDWTGERHGGTVDVPTSLFLQATCATVRVHGWVPKSAYSGMPTAEVVRYVIGLERPARDDKELRQMVEAVTLTDADTEEAKKVADWARAIPSDTTDNYLGNVRVALGGAYVSPKHFGIAASAVSARRKTEEKQRQKEETEGKRAASVHVGTVGTRQVFTVHVLFVRAFEGEYGTTYLVEMEDESGNILKTFASGAFGRDASRGDRATIKATVKEHTEYNGTAQTMLARVAVQEWHEEKPSADPEADVI